VQWSEPRLNLSTEFFDTENVTGEEQLVPGRNRFVNKHQGDQKIGRKFAEILGKVAQTVAKPKIATICSKKAQF
jgi:hypothetical protein